MILPTRQEVALLCCCAAVLPLDECAALTESSSARICLAPARGLLLHVLMLALVLALALAKRLAGPLSTVRVYVCGKRL